MKKLSIGIQIFQKSREDDYVYIDNKVDMPEEKAPTQIKVKGKKIVLIGIGLSSEKKTLSNLSGKRREYKIERPEKSMCRRSFFVGKFRPCHSARVSG